MARDFIMLYRSMRLWEWYKDSNTKCVFLHILLSANHAETSWQGITILPGQWITSSISLADATGLSRQNVRTSLNRLKSTNEITIKSTNKYILITITNWATYQSSDRELTNKSTNKLTINQPTTNQQLTTNNNDNNGKRKRKENIVSDKSPFGKFNNVMMTDDEYNGLVTDYGKSVADLGIEKVSQRFAQYPKSGYTNSMHSAAVVSKLESMGYEKLKPQIEIPQIDSPEQQEINRAKVAEALAKGLGLK